MLLKIGSDTPFPRENIFSLKNDAFTQTALEVFHYQYENNLAYRSFVNQLHIQPDRVETLEQIPFFPVSLFKELEVKCGNFEAEKVFASSTTIGKKPSLHYIKSLSWYRQVYVKIFHLFYGDPGDFVFLALLPGYLERNDASLVYMVKGLSDESGQAENGFYLHNTGALIELLKSLEAQGKKSLLIGVSHALLDFAEVFQFQLNHTIIMETGGMKGKRKELWRTELHDILKDAFGLNEIHSEYGMTELMSQAYAPKDGIYKFPEWCKVLRRDAYDPFEVTRETGRGLLNIIDLANLDSCCFLAIDDVVEILPEQEFKVLGRMQASEARGCNLMVF